MINSCAKKKKNRKDLSTIRQGVTIKKCTQKKKKEVGTLQDISSPEDSNIHGGNYDSEVRKTDT